MQTIVLYASIYVLSQLIFFLLPIYLFDKDYRRFRNIKPKKVILNQSEAMNILDANFEIEMMPNLSIRFNKSLGEIIFVGIVPIAGIILTNNFLHIKYQAFDPYNILFLLIILAYIGYWAIRLLKDELSPKLLQLFQYLSMIWLLITPILFLFFLPFCFMAIIFYPFLVTPLIAPLPIFFYEYRVLQETRRKEENTISKNSFSISNILFLGMVTFLVLSILVCLIFSLTSVFY